MSNEREILRGVPADVIQAAKTNEMRWGRLLRKLPAVAVLIKDVGYRGRVFLSFTDCGWVDDTEDGMNVDAVYRLNENLVPPSDPRRIDYEIVPDNNGFFHSTGDNDIGDGGWSLCYLESHERYLGTLYANPFNAEDAPVFAAVGDIRPWFDAGLDALHPRDIFSQADLATCKPGVPVAVRFMPPNN